MFTLLGYISRKRQNRSLRSGSSRMANFTRGRLKAIKLARYKKMRSC